MHSQAEARLREALAAGPTETWSDCGGFTPSYGALTSPDGYIVFGYADADTQTEHGKPIKAPSTAKQFVNRKFIAAANPDAIRELLDSLKAMRGALSEFVDEFSSHKLTERERIEKARAALLTKDTPSNG